jgi:hypothetical protein
MGDHYALFDYWRFAMTTICSVDAFYVGFYREDRKIVYPYTFDVALTSGEYVPPEVFGYGPKGQAAWILKHRRAYTFASDNGRLLHHGVAFGDEKLVSADAITIPIFERRDAEQAIIGLASVQSYMRDAYAGEHVRAFEWTARSVATVLAREREDALAREELAAPGAGSETDPPTLMEVVQDVSAILAGLHAGRPSRSTAPRCSARSGGSGGSASRVRPRRWTSSPGPRCTRRTFSTRCPRKSGRSPF